MLKNGEEGGFLANKLFFNLFKTSAIVPLVLLINQTLTVRKHKFTADLYVSIEQSQTGLLLALVTD